MAMIAAVDLGASSGRVMVAEVSPSSLQLREVSRFSNVPVAVGGTLHWDILRIYRAVVEGLRAAGPVDSVGVDSWGVDYGLLDADGVLLGNPVHYRDARTTGVTKPEVDLYEVTGIQHLPFNTVFQLLAARKSAQLAAARTLLMIPDLISYWLTGSSAASLGVEVTNASTTQLLNVHTRQWSADLMRQLDIPCDLFPPLRHPGTVIGPCAEVPGTVVAVGSHDTASAVAGVPAGDDRFAYISCGTWSLAGVTLESPVVTPEAKAANFTNEAGIDGQVRFLRNVMGLWLLQECQRVWGIKDLEELLTAAASLPGNRSIVDPDDPVFLPPGDMPGRIAAACMRSGHPVPADPPSFTRCIMDSLALAHHRALADAQRLSGKGFDVIHMVGGGARNQLLCQLTADACGVPVAAGPYEATALGNVLVQARALGVVGSNSESMRALLRASQPVTWYEPSAGRTS